jgi:membrane protease YdiL (CAAX protease family)
MNESATGMDGKNGAREDSESIEKKFNGHEDSPLSLRQRLFAAGEVLVGAAVVVGHNVYHVLPNEVPILVLILWASLLLRRAPWRSIGFGAPVSWKFTAIVAVGTGALLQLKDLVVEPLAHLLWHQQENISSVLSNVHHEPLSAFKSLAIVWTFAAFGEEIAYRALLLRRAADAMNGSVAAYGAALVFSSVLFGFGHFYKGPTGIFDSTVSGLILGGAYLATRRNLWAPILGHGLSDTFAVVATYFGW